MPFSVCHDRSRAEPFLSLSVLSSSFSQLLLSTLPDSPQKPCGSGVAVESPCEAKPRRSYLVAFSLPISQPLISISFPSLLGRRGLRIGQGLRDDIFRATMEPANHRVKPKLAIPFAGFAIPPTTSKLSYAERRAQMSPSPAPRLVEGDRNLLGIDRALPGDVVHKATKSQSRPGLAKKRSNFFEDAFSVKEVNPARERVRSEAIVMAEVRTNVIVSRQSILLAPEDRAMGR